MEGAWLFTLSFVITRLECWPVPALALCPDPEHTLCLVPFTVVDLLCEETVHEQESLGAWAVRGAWAAATCRAMDNITSRCTQSCVSVHNVSRREASLSLLEKLSVKNLEGGFQVISVFGNFKLVLNM